MDLKHSKFKKEDLIFLICFLLIICIQCYKARLGVGSKDEHFYISLGYRFYKGDALFYDDWHIAQMIGFFITPLVSLFRSVAGNNEGLVLGFRYFYIIFTLTIGICIYLKFRKQYGISAILASCIYMLFTPFQIMALSYNTMSVGFLFLALLVYKRHHLLRLFLSGMFYGCAVINTPYLALGYIVLIYLVVKKKNILSIRDFISISLGIATIAISFLAFVFSRESLNSVLSSIKYLVDPSHSTSIPELFAINGFRLLQAFGLSFTLLVFELVYAVVFRRKYQERKVLEITNMITCIVLVYIGLIHPVDIYKGGFIYVLLPFYLMGFIYVLLLSKDFYLNFCFGVSTFHALLLSISSNVGPRSYLGPLIIACSITALIISQYNRNKKWENIIVLVFVAFLAFYKMTSIYLGSNEYSIKIAKGPLKGLYDSSEIVENYNKTLNDIHYIDTLDGDYINCITFNTWEYLASNKQCGTNSTYIYFWYKDQYENAYDLYASIHQEKKPWVYLDYQTPFDIDEKDDWMKQFTKVKELENGILYQ